MEKRKRRPYSEEFKLEAIELADRTNATKAAAELGIHPITIRVWRKQFEAQGGPNKSLKEKKSYGDLEKENRRLQKENGYLKEINKVLKKARQSSQQTTWEV